MNMTDKLIRIAVVGDFSRYHATRRAIDGSVQHAAAKLRREAQTEWLVTTGIDGDAANLLAKYDGIWASPGSPFRSFDGMLRAIQFARTREWPFLGTCAGFQHALIEYARDVLGIADAHSAEYRTESQNIVVTPIDCPVDPSSKIKLSGLGEVRINPRSRLYGIYRRDMAQEEYLCNYEANLEFESKLQEAGLVIGARGSHSEMRAVELRNHPFYLATLFQPHLTSTAAQPHPVVVAFLEAAIHFHDYGGRRAAAVR